jgi:hypothetical protein
MPLDPTTLRVRELVHVEVERKRADADLVADDHPLRSALHHFRRYDPRVVPDMAGIVHDHAPHLIG